MDNNNQIDLSKVNVKVKDLTDHINNMVENFKLKEEEYKE